MPHVRLVRHHQLFFADMAGYRDTHTAPRRFDETGRKPPPPPAYRPETRHVQPALSDDVVRRHYRYGRYDLRRGPAPDNPWLAWALYIAYDLAEKRGWGSFVRGGMQRTLVMLLAGHIDGELIRVSDFYETVAEHSTNIDDTIEILTVMDVVLDDREQAFDRWLRAELDGLAPAIRRDTHTWTTLLHNGGPRNRARAPGTAADYLRTIRPALTAWSTRYGHLREVTRDDVIAYLEPLTGPPRERATTALRSLFVWAKRANVIFRNPAVRLRVPQRADPVWQPLRPDELARTVATATTVHARLFVALAAVHAARVGQIRALQLDDVDLGNRRITIAGHDRPLDDLTHQTLLAWLEHRRTRWPVTANRHLVISPCTAGGLGPVSYPCLARPLRGLPATLDRLRVDRQLEEALTSGADPLHVAAVFGVSDATAIRYADNARQLLARPHESGPSGSPRTQGSRPGKEPDRHFSSR
ncbi:site-specific integrase [Frankia sp. EAN1pec]|uniref:site-specific integrase n=1 Tax=Parafrankia sp. (strain EAN1pec) TaxID=298653 RepID=UPI0018DC6E76